MGLGRRLAVPAGGALELAKARQQAKTEYGMDYARTSEAVSGTSAQVVVSSGKRQGVITLRGRTRSGDKITSSAAALLHFKCKGETDVKKVKACINEATGRYPDLGKKKTRAQIITELKKMSLTENQLNMLSPKLRKDIG